MEQLALALTAATFLLTLAIVMVPYWLFVVYPERKTRATVQKRITVAAAGLRAIRLDLLKQAERLSYIGALNWLLSRSGFLTTPVKRTIDRAALQVTVSVVLLACATSGLVAFTIVTRLTHIVWPGLVVLPAAAVVPFLIVRYKGGKRLAKLEEQFPDAIDLIARTLRAGHAFPTALGLATEELPDPMRAEFKTLYDRQNYGLPIPDALREFAARVPLLDVRFFVTSVLTQRQTGGNLTEILDNLAAVIRERFRIKRHVRGVSAHGRMTALVLSLMAPSVAAIMLVVSPENMTLLFQDPLGQKMVGGAVVLQIIGTLVVRKLSNIEY